jgi:hypothetical protein
MNSTNYKEPTVPRKLMAGKGAPKPTIFGVIGKTHTDAYTKSLGGLVRDTKTNYFKNSIISKPSGIQTENCILGPNPSAVAKQHYGQVPYDGRFYKALGPKV